MASTEPTKSKFSLHHFGLDMKIWLDNVPEDKRTRLIRVIGIERAFPETMSPT